MELEAEPHQAGTGLIYRLRRGQSHHPMIVMLHGLSGDENVMWIFAHALPRAATVIAPRALYAGELSGYSWARSVVRDDLDQVDYTAAQAAVQALIGEATRLYEIDPQRVIVMGFSQGAALSYTLSLAQPQLLRGVIALAGYLPQHAQPAGQPRDAAKSQQALPHYLIIHGTQDEAVPIERARQARSVLESRGASVEYHEHQVGHRVSAQGMREITRWTKQLLA